MGHVYVPQTIDFLMMQNGERGTLAGRCKRCKCELEIDYEKKKYIAEYTIRKAKL